MASQQKKKRTEEPPLPTDGGQRPVPLQRRRVWRACESCRRKKIKCDGTEPTCSQCSSSGSQCTWLQTKDRAALSRHYVQELEARLLHMESLFSQIAPVLDHLGQSANAPPGAQPPQSPATSAAAASAASIIQSLVDKDKASHVTDNRSTPDSSASVKIEDDVVDGLGQLALDEHGHMRWIGGSSTMSLIQSFKAATSAPHFRVSPMAEDTSTPNKLYFPASVFFGKVRALPGPEEVEYPDRDLADTLVDAYFTRFHFLCPVLDKPTFLRQYAFLMDRTNDPTLARTETAFIALVFAVFACAAQLVDDPRLKGEKEDDGGVGMVYYERALILHYISHASIQVPHVQCFVLLSSFLCSVNCLPQAWLLIGQAVRMGQDLGLHRSPQRINISLVEKETRRKIWWGVYILDRMLALALGRPLGAEDSDCDVELPVAIDDDHLPEYFAGSPMANDSPSLMAGFIALTSLYKIAGRVMRQVYGIDKQENVDAERRAQLQQDVEALDKELTQWLDDLPPVFKTHMVNERQVSMGAVLSSHYYSVLTALHRNLLPVTKDQPIAPRSAAKAVSSARTCIRLAPFIKNVVPPSHHLAFFIQHLFSCAVIVLLYAMHVSDEHAANAALDEAQICLPALESWEGLWPGARKCRELLSELMATAREAVNSNQQNGSSSMASPSNIPLPQSAPRSSTSRERRRSFSSSQPMAGKPIRNKLNLRRNLSPESRQSRPSHGSAAIRYESQRARSTSRRRGHEDVEDADRPGHHPYRLQFPLRPSQSALSSPTSAGSYNSPRLNLVELDRSPAVQTVPSFSTSLNGPVSPVPNMNGYDFDFMQSQSNPFSQTGGAEQWNYDDKSLFNNNQDQGLGLFEPPSFEQPATIDPSALYGGSGASSSQIGGGLYGLPPVAPSTTFPTPGLPFHGFDYLRNYDGFPNGGEQDLLGQGFDANVFRIEPDLPFTLGELSSDGAAGGGGGTR
ncbi:fungal-specific transcription factor domain-containing protein [Amylostereum chailletii]|nr:fungal-specific transcription factor domain-containing protein [Amylostereum chailletii]